MTSEPQDRATALPRRAIQWEILVVLWVSLGASAVRALLNLIDRLTLGVALDQQQARIITPVTPDRPWLDVLYQLGAILLPLGAVALVGYLLWRSGDGFAGIGFDLREPGRDLVRGAVLALVIGVAGLVLYAGALRVGLSVRVAAAEIAGNWWDWPVLVLHAASNAVVEEVIVLGFLLLRLDQWGLAARWAILLSALLRGTYHLYQGFGAFVGNVAMGLVFGWLFWRWRRVGPFVVAHLLIDTVAFVGAAAGADELLGIQP